MLIVIHFFFFPIWNIRFWYLSITLVKIGIGTLFFIFYPLHPYLHLLQILTYLSYPGESSIHNITNSHLSVHFEWSIFDWHFKFIFSLSFDITWTWSISNITLHALPSCRISTKISSIAHVDASQPLDLCCIKRKDWNNNVVETGIPSICRPNFVLLPTI